MIMITKPCSFIFFKNYIFHFYLKPMFCHSICFLFIFFYSFYLFIYFCFSVLFFCLYKSSTFAHDFHITFIFLPIVNVAFFKCLQRSFILTIGTPRKSGTSLNAMHMSIRRRASKTRPIQIKANFFKKKQTLIVVHPKHNTFTVFSRHINYYFLRIRGGFLLVFN